MSLSKLEVMKQKTLDELLMRLIDSKPGFTSEKLFLKAKEWGKPPDEEAFEFTLKFDATLLTLHEKGYRVTNKQWYPANHVAPPKLQGPKEPHPKQTRWAF